MKDIDEVIADRKDLKMMDLLPKGAVLLGWSYFDWVDAARKASEGQPVYVRRRRVGQAVNTVRDFRRMVRETEYRNEVHVYRLGRRVVFEKV